MQSLFNFSSSESLAVLRALKTVAMADGKFAVKEQTMLMASAELLGVEVDPRDLPTIGPAELANLVTGGAARVVALKACLVMGIVDGQISPEEWKVLSEFRAALAIDEAQLHSFHDLVHQHRQLTMHEYQRRLASTERGTLYASEGWRGVMQFFPEDVLAAANSHHHATAHQAAKENAELGLRYRQLGNLADGTLGRELWRYYREREFAFAGEPGTVPEALVHHDIIHIISGYDSSLEGELQTLAYTAGMRQEDPFSALFLVLLQFTTGLKVAPGGSLAGARALFDPDKVLAALDRGRGTAVDFSQKHDYWDEMEQSIASLRERFGVPALT
jgi:tellurite resistance protein